jgi:hypothetical protein
MPPSLSISSTLLFPTPPLGVAVAAQNAGFLNRSHKYLDTIKIAVLSN